MKDDAKSWTILTMNTLAFTVSFACWTMNGVLVTWLVDQMVFSWDKVQIGWLIGIPVLSGALARLPVGVLTDKYGGRPVFTLLMLIAAVPAWLMSYADSYGEFLLGSFGFGLAGATFAVGIAYTSVWFRRERQGTALGIFGIGNAGAALTSMGAPAILNWLTGHGRNLEAWRTLPRLYAAALVATAVVFFLLTTPRKVEHGQGHSLRQRLAPLKSLRVWRFGLYYFLVFGGFVALAQWLIPYYVSVYGMSVVMAGLVATIFTLPSGLIRALGGWMSDHWGARAVMYWVFGVSLVSLVLLCVPRMEVVSPGEGVVALRKGVVTAVTAEEIVVGEQRYRLRTGDPPAGASSAAAARAEGFLVLPTAASWQEPVVQVGQEVAKKELLARGVTHVYFQANVWIFTFLVFVLGIAMGIGKAGVYKYIPDYFPKEVGVVGGIVGVLGGLGGFVCPILFGYLLRSTGIWTVTWMFLALVTLACLVWMHLVVRRILKQKGMAHQIEHEHEPRAAALPAPAKAPEVVYGHR